MNSLYVVLQVMTEAGPVELARFWDMGACSLVLRLLSEAGGTGWCLAGWAA